MQWHSAVSMLEIATSNNRNRYDLNTAVYIPTCAATPKAAITTARISVTKGPANNA